MIQLDTALPEPVEDRQVRQERVAEEKGQGDPAEDPVRGAQYPPRGGRSGIAARPPQRNAARETSWWTAITVAREDADPDHPDAEPGDGERRDEARAGAVQQDGGDHDERTGDDHRRVEDGR